MRGIADPSRQIPGTRFLGRRRSARRCSPTSTTLRLTGGAVFDDGQMYSPPRLVLAFVKSAVASGAVACNYVEAVGLCLGRRSRARRQGARPARRRGVRDPRPARPQCRRAGRGIPARAQSALRQRGAAGLFSRDACFVVRRKPRSKFALAVQGQSRDREFADRSRGAPHVHRALARLHADRRLAQALQRPPGRRRSSRTTNLQAGSARSTTATRRSRLTREDVRLPELRARAFRRRDRRHLGAQLRQGVALHRSPEAPRRRWARHADRHPLHDGARRCRGRTRPAARADAKCAGPGAD